jgi:hypothetical protein
VERAHRLSWCLPPASIWLLSAVHSDALWNYLNNFENLHILKVAFAVVHKAATTRACPSGLVSTSDISTPMRRTAPGCCARAASGQTIVASPRLDMNWRLSVSTTIVPVPMSLSPLQCGEEYHALIGRSATDFGVIRC